MNCDGEDILNVDIDPDFLISLVGKLSLTNIADITETLQSIENNTDAAELKNGACSSSASLEYYDISAFKQQSIENNIDAASLEANLKNDACSSSASVQYYDISAFNPPRDSSCSGSSNKESKDGFLSSIGLLSASHSTTEAKHNPLPQDNFIDDDAGLWMVALGCDSKTNNESCRAKEKLVSGKDLPSKRKDHIKKTSEVNIQENGTCDNVESQWQDLSFLSGASFPHKSVNSLQDVFSQRGMVYDIQLSDIGGTLKLPSDIDEETVPQNSLPPDSDNAHCLPQSDTNEDSVDESVCSPDSGMGTSPCPSAVSPYSPSADCEHSDDSEEYDRLYEEDLEMLLAELIEIENSLRYVEVPQSTANVPVLRDAKNREDYIDNILNFLKEPVLNDQLPLFEEDDRPGFPELLVENIVKSGFKSSSKHIKKSSPRSKKHKLGLEFK